MADPRSSPMAARRWLRWLLLGLAGCTALLLLLAGLLAVGLELDASHWRAELSQVLSQALGRRVTIDGTVRLRVAIRPALQVRDLRIGQPAGFQVPPGTMDTQFATLGEAAFALDPWDWTARREVRLIRLDGRDLTLRPRRDAHGRANWVFEPPAARAESRAARGPLPGIAIEQVDIAGVHIDWLDADGDAHRLALDTLSGSASMDAPLQLTLAGNVEGHFPFHARVDGGPLRLLWRTSEPWPIQLSASFLGSNLNAQGELARAAGGLRGRLAVGLGSPDLIELERLLEVSLPKLGATALAFELGLQDDRLTLDGLVASLGRSTLSGSMTFSQARGGTRPRLTGTLRAAELDLAPFLNAPRRQEPTGTLAQWYRQASEAQLAFDGLRRLDLSLALQVDRWLGVPGNVRDARLVLEANDGALHAPLAATVADVAMGGDLVIDARQQPAQVDLALGVRDSPLGGLAELLLGMRGVQGAIGGLALRANGSGRNVGELLRDLEARLVVMRGGLTYGNTAGDAPVAFGLDTFELVVPAGGKLVATAQGSLLGQPLQARLAGASLDHTMRGAAPIVVTADSRSLRAQLHGTLGAADGSGTDLRLTLTAAQAGDAARWLKLPAGSRQPLALDTRVRMMGDQWSLDDLAIRLGRNRLAGRLARTLAQGRPLVQMTLAAEVIDVDELQALLVQDAVPAAAVAATPTTAPATAAAPPAAPAPPTAAASAPRPDGASRIDVPILPSGLNLTDSDLDVTIRRLTSRALSVDDIRFAARMRGGELLASPFSMKLSGTQFDGAIALDLRARLPSAQLWLAAEEADIGRLLSQLRISDRIDARSERLVLHAQAEGARLSDLAAHTQLQVDLQGGQFSLRNERGAALVSVLLQRGRLHGNAGQPLQLVLDGSVDAEPVRIDLSAVALPDLLAPDRPLPFSLDASAAGTSLHLSGRIARPVRDRTLELAVSLSGERLNTLSRLARAALPPWGPYSLTGRMRLEPERYEVGLLTVRVGSSTLHGRGTLQTTTTPPRLAVALNAPAIQLDDFRFGDWHPEGPSRDDRAEPDTADKLEQLRRKATSASARTERLLSRDVLRRQDAELTVRVEQVLSGRDRLGAGSLTARVANGRLDIDPVEVAMEGGSASLALGYQPGEQEVAVDTRIRVHRFDYGVLARRIRPADNLQGRFSLELDVSARPPQLSQLMRHGTGRLDFAVWPQDMRAEVFDLWAANLLVALANRVDPSAASRLNCGIGRFVLRDGVLSPRLLLLDTTRVRVLGEGRADFRDQSIDFSLKPQPKEAQFFSLATPVRVGGNFGNYQIGVDTSAVLATIGRLATSLFWVPLRKLFGDNAPADGKDVCNEAFTSLEPPVNDAR